MKSGPAPFTYLKYSCFAALTTGSLPKHNNNSDNRSNNSDSNNNGNNNCECVRMKKSTYEFFSRLLKVMMVIAEAKKRKLAEHFFRLREHSKDIRCGYCPFHHVGFLSLSLFMQSSYLGIITPST